jgi:hypothetical protein
MFMKKIIINNSILLMLLVFVCACENTQFSREANPLQQHEIDQSNAGLVLHVHNALPEQQIGSSRVRPHLNAYICTPLPSEGAIPPVEERCLFLTGMINNGTTETFLISQNQLADLYQKGDGYVSFEFSDDQQMTSVISSCYIPHHRTRINADFLSRQDWSVTVNQRFGLFYGCLIDRINE